MAEHSTTAALKTKTEPGRKAALQLKMTKTLRQLRRTWILYLFILPMLIYVVIFDYLPMYGIQIAFRDFRAMDGILGSPWVGLKHFRTFFESYQFKSLLWNTVALSLYQLAAGFPLPILFALLLNYIGNRRFKKSAQMITYAPHFISMVVYVGMITIFLSSDGIVNQFLMLLGFDQTRFLSNPGLFRHIYVWSGVLQNIGWGSIMYISVLASVPPELHEAAMVDGASKLKRLLYIDIPAIIPTMIIMLIMRTGEIMSLGFEKAFLLQNDINLDFSEIISTYVYKVGILGGQVSYSSAIGLFNSLINFGLLLVVNSIARKTSDISLW